MPEYTISLDQPNRPDGDPIEVPPFGVIENGGSITVEAERDEVAFLAGGYGITVIDKSNKKVRNTTKKDDETEGGEDK